LLINKTTTNSSQICPAIQAPITQFKSEIPFSKQLSIKPTNKSTRKIKHLLLLLQFQIHRAAPSCCQAAAVQQPLRAALFLSATSLPCSSL
jgi:hypothetical protein